MSEEKPLQQQPSDLGDLEAALFWERHKKSILVLAGLVVIVAIIGGGVAIYQENRRLAANAAFAEAQGLDGLQSFEKEFAGSVPAGNALLLIAGMRRDAGDLDASTADLERMIRDYPKHPLVSEAWVGLAANEALQGKPDEAISTLQETTAKYSDSFVAAYALFTRGQMLLGEGRNEEAAEVFRTLVSDYGDSAAASAASSLANRLEDAMPPAEQTPASTAPPSAASTE